MSKEFKINAFKAYKDTKMPKGKDVIYELLNISPDKDNKGMFNIPWTYISPSDVIEHEGEFHEIGIVRTYNPDGSVVLNNEVSFMPSTFGRLALTPGNPMHEEVYRFFQWCNKNASNPNRREEVEPLKTTVWLALAEAAVVAPTARPTLNKEDSVTLVNSGVIVRSRLPVISNQSI